MPHLYERLHPHALTVLLPIQRRDGGIEADPTYRFHFVGCATR